MRLFGLFRCQNTVDVLFHVVEAYPWSVDLVLKTTPVHKYTSKAKLIFYYMLSTCCPRFK